MSSQQIPSHQISQKERGWYSVSVASVRRTVTGVSTLAIIVILFVGYNQWLILTLEDRARTAVDEATSLTLQIERREDYRQIYSEHKAAWDQLEEAKAALVEANFEHALDRGQSCVLTLKTILGLSQGSIRVLSLGGNVEFRRGERGAWKRLRSSDSLNPGDWVKTATDGTARLLFGDGSEFTLRQSTMARLGGAAGGGKETNLAFGNVELNTSEAGGSTVSTPKSTARVMSDSEALVSFDRDKGSGRFASFAGSLEVSSKAGGATRTVNALQQVEQIGDQLSELQDLPAPPVLAGPGNDRAFDFDSQKEITLSWQPVSRARRYQLRISTTRLFATTVIDNVRSKTSARLGIQGEGNFYWQVAGIDKDDTNGPWSEPRAFRIAKLSAAGVDDRTPPDLEVLGTETLGNLVIVNGQTESGASVTINGEAVVLKPDGSFSKTIQMMQSGWVTLEIVATDAWKNESSQKRRVFIDAV